MAALTKNDLVSAMLNELAGFPTVAQFVQAGDPRVLAQLNANATMLAMISAQVENAKFEPFVKSRDGTVLADSALKGILPLGRACRVTLELTNMDSQPVTLGIGRIFLDAKGRNYVLDSSVTIASGSSENVTATQIRRRVLTYKVTTASDFYSIPITLSTDEQHLSSLQVSLGDTIFGYSPDWCNVAADEMAYQVEVDELRQMFIRFGKASVVGYGVQAGDEFTIELSECQGKINDLQAGADFNLEYILTPQDATTKVKLVSVDDEGASPHTMPELRVMAKYPAIYDHNAVYLGEFEFLLRRYISNVRFLAVWNEQVEESVRGADVDNINTLFVSGLVTGMSNAEFEARATALIKRADSSYRVRFVPAVLTPVAITVTASIAISWDRATIESQIRALLLENYGDGASEVSLGMTQPIKRAVINRLLSANIDALRDDKAEFNVAVTLPTTLLPELFLHLTAASITVNVSSVDYGSSLWNT